MEKTQTLIELSKPLPFTFHRAFDLIEDQEAALEQLITIGAQRVLTSGGKASAPEAQHQLKKLVETSNDQIIILAGGGIKSNNINKLLKTGCKEFHMTANAIVESPAEKGPIMLNANSAIPEQNYKVSNLEEIINVNHQLNTFSKIMNKKVIKYLILFLGIQLAYSQNERIEYPERKTRNPKR